MKSSFPLNCLFLVSIALSAATSQDAAPGLIPLPTSKLLGDTIPGRIGFLNSFPAAIALSPDGRYAAVLNNGYGTAESQAQQSIAVLDLSTLQLKDFPDSRFGAEAHQSYFLGLAFASNGRFLYASVVSLTDTTGKKRGNIGNGIAVYRFEKGKVKRSRFLPIPPLKLAPGKRVATALGATLAGTAIAYPAGLAVISVNGNDELLVANNLSDTVVLLDSQTGKILRRFDVSTNEVVPSSFPYTVIAKRDASRAWCSLWNASKVAELDLISGRVVRWISLLAPNDVTAPGSHPTALMLSPDEKSLYVTLSNADALAVINTASGEVVHLASAKVAGQEYPGAYPNALAQSADGKKVFVADASLNAVAVFDADKIANSTASTALSGDAIGFIPTDWYPSALAVSENQLLIAAAKGKGTTANNRINKLEKQQHRKYPFIPNMLYGSLAGIDLRDLEDKLTQFTGQVREHDLLLSNPGKIEFRAGRNPIRHVVYILKENRTYDQILGDLTLNGLQIGNGDASVKGFCQLKQAPELTIPRGGDPTTRK